jgi:hypothetical protein
MFPRGGLDQNGELLFRPINLPRPEFIDLDLSDFHLDEYYLDLVCFAVFQSASKIVKASGGQFFVTTSMGSLSSQLKRRLDAAQIPVVDTGLKGAELASLFGDYHSNAEAHRIHARKIHEFLLGCSTSPALQQKGRQR